MKQHYLLSISIVIYNEELSGLKKRLKILLQSALNLHIYLIDNSRTPNFEFDNFHQNLTYIFNEKNLGYGKGHNLILNKLNSDFHLVLNPDVDFNPEILTALIQRINSEKSLGLISPKAYYPDGSLQYLCRKNPTFISLINRLFNFSNQLTEKTEYRTIDLENQHFNPEFIHGCFMVFKTEVFKNLKGFDERFFLYMEDADICRRLWNSGLKIEYFPEVSIVHQHRRASKKNVGLFFIHLQSAFQYFFKWGF